MNASHIYGDWVKSEAKVGIIIAEEDEHVWSKNFKIRWSDGRVYWSNDFDLITEHEYFEVVDPSRCGESINQILAKLRSNQTEDYFTGGFMSKTMHKEDFFQ